MKIEVETSGQLYIDKQNKSCKFGDRRFHFI